MPATTAISSRAASTFPLKCFRVPGGTRRLQRKKAGESRRYLLLAVIVGGAMLFVESCGSPSIGDPSTARSEHDSRSIAVGGARTVRAEFLLGAGNLNMGGGAEGLMEADFSYGLEDWKPEVSYDVSGDEGELTVEQGRGEVPVGREVRNDWNLRLSEEVPTDLLVEMGAGRSDLDLRDLDLTALELEVGAGRAAVDLSGDYAEDLDASIQGGIGELGVRLPGEDVGVRVNAEGLGRIDARCLRKEGGTYVNDAYGDSDVTLNVDIEGGIGLIHLEGSECPL